MTTMSSRQQRRQFERQIRKLIRDRGDNCSICGIKFQHNDRTFGGFNLHNEVALVGECCIDHMREIYAAGIFTRRSYDFLHRGKHDTSEGGYSTEQIAQALGTFQRAIAVTDEEMKDVWRRGGMSLPHGSIHTLDYPWKADDRHWFEQHPERSHRARLPFAGEANPEEMGDTPEGHQPIMLIRQVEPGKRIRAGFFIPIQVLPVPDHEAVAHALFDIATRRVPIPRGGEAMAALIKKYTIQGEQ